MSERRAGKFRISVGGRRKAGGTLFNGRYRIEKQIGRGGVGEVLLAVDEHLERRVAVKRIHLDFAEGPARAKEALSEARKLARLQHPNIITVYDVLSSGEDVLIVMEYLHGKTLEDLTQPMPIDQFLDVARQSLTGLAAAHGLGMIHMDIKPTNLMLHQLNTGQPQIKILDFGLATMLEHYEPPEENAEGQASVLGSVYTMAPEQLERRPVGIRTDLYSLGCVFYRTLTMQDPFEGATAEEVMYAHLDHRFTPLAELRPDLPQQICAWVERMMAREPKERPRNAQAALKELFASVPARRAGDSESPAGLAPEVDAGNREELLRLEGERVAVSGVVERTWANAAATASFLNFANVDPRQFAVVLPSGVPGFDAGIVEQLQGRRVRAEGIISLFHGNPQMVLDAAERLSVLE